MPFEADDRERPPDTRDRIVAATAELFRRRGYHATSLKDVTTAAAAPVGSLYHHFPGGKADLARVVLTETGAAYQELFELIAAGAEGAEAAVGDFFDGAAAVLETTDYIDLCPIGAVAREVADTDDTLRQASAAVFDSWTGAAATLFSAAGIAPDEARRLAVTVIALLEGGFTLARTQRDADILRHLGHHARQLVALHLPGPGPL